MWAHRITRITRLTVGGLAVLSLSFWVTLTMVRNLTGEPLPPPGRGVCYFDAEKLCPGVQPGEGRILACLSRQLDKQISEACRKEVDKYLKERR
jgi:hypothetical protein